MPPFDFADSFEQGFQASLDRAQQRKRQRALNRIRMRRLRQRAEQARKDRQLKRDRLDFRRNRQQDRQDLRERKFAHRSFMDMRRLLQNTAPEPGTIEVQRQNVEALPGEGSARVDPNVLIRRHGQASDGQSGNGGGQGASGGPTPSTPQEARDALQGFLQQEQEAAEAGVSTDSLRTIQDRIAQSKEALDSLTTGSPDFMELRQQAMADTADADTTRADTTRADSTTTRGLGRTPGHVSPQELGMSTGGGNPGGGSGEPSSGGARLRDMGGQPRSTEKLIGEAKSLATEQGIEAVGRRLDALLDEGRIDSATRDRVRALALAELVRLRQQAR